MRKFTFSTEEMFNLHVLFRTWSQTGLLKYVKEISTSSAFINILITVLTKPPRFAETGVFGTLP